MINIALNDRQNKGSEFWRKKQEIIMALKREGPRGWMFPNGDPRSPWSIAVAIPT